MQSKIFYVDATAQNTDGKSTWQPTGIHLRKGQDISIVAVGYASMHNPVEYYLDPAGRNDAAGTGYLAPKLDIYSLIGKVGTVDPIQFGNNWIGEFKTEGELMLAYNDSIAKDNLGGFMVTVIW